MGTGSNAAQEVIVFRRSQSTPGFHLMDAEHSPREWRVFSPFFYVVVFRTWSGSVHVAGRTEPAAPGFVLCQKPDQLIIGRPEGGLPGSFKVLEFTAELLQEWLAEQPGAALRPEWSAAIQRLSPSVGAKFSEFFDAFDPAASPLQLQSELLQVSEVMVRSLIAGAKEHPSSLQGPPIRGTARMRECLHEEGLDIDLETLASRVGLNRFQALRAFKRRYGLPPHAYQLAVRLGLARRMLIDGAAPVDVALRCGFVDQSHFNRHFKRAYGVAPLRYVRGERGGSGVYLAAKPCDPEKILAGSDR